MRFNREHHNVWLEPEGYDSSMDSLLSLPSFVIKVTARRDLPKRHLM